MQLGHHETPRRATMIRRACDQCRTRKVACDQKSPCSNCIVLKAQCAHSARLAKAASPKQRIHLSSQYERKLDEIVESVREVKTLLNKQKDDDRSLGQDYVVRNVSHAQRKQSPVSSGGLSQGYSAMWDQPSDIMAFLNALMDKKASFEPGTGQAGTMASVENLIQALKHHSPAQPCSDMEGVDSSSNEPHPALPPLNAIVTVLRWVKGHHKGVRIDWLSQMLPLQTFLNICQRVCFAVDDYTMIDMVLASGFLAITFSEYAISVHQGDPNLYWEMCRRVMYRAVGQLPLTLSASMEGTAALAMAAYCAVEESKVTLAWTLISTAARFCMTLMLYGPRKSVDQSGLSSESLRESLFWVVHRIEKGLALRLARPSNIRDIEISWPLATAPRFARTASIQGRVFDELYSRWGLKRQRADRGKVANALAVELRKLLEDIEREIVDTVSEQSASESRTLVKYLQCEAICNSTLLVMVLRALPPEPGAVSGIANDCIVAAREVLDVHHQQIVDFGESGDASMLKVYLRWGIMHIPFVAFSVIYSQLIRSLDMDDLDRLERFTSSLRMYDTTADSASHPCRIYEVFCSAMRLHFEMEGRGSMPETTSKDESLMMPDDILAMDDLGDWFLENQQIMSFMDEVMMQHSWL